MSVMFKIQSSSGSYEVVIGVGVRPDHFSPNTFTLVDEQVKNLWIDSIPPNAFSILAVEQNKTLATGAQIIEAMRSQGLQRGSLLHAYGGGIIQDLATLSASLYMRGIHWTYYPTTLLGMVDSCIGGKSSINVGSYKNIAGNFYPPQKIIIDVEFCKTLNLPDQIAGLCEAVKICFAANTDSFERYIHQFSSLRLPASGAQLLPLVELSLLTKKTFIEEDEFDRGPRLLLNFGHSIGHAIEAATHFAIPHGIAVGLGMLAEFQLGVLTNGWDSLPKRAQVLNSYLRNLFALVPDTIHALRELDVSLALDAFKSDKKHTQQSYVVVTINQEGFLERVSIPRTQATDAMVVKIIQWLKKDFDDEVQ
jgi:3-dehydroquinate synthase